MSSQVRIALVASPGDAEPLHCARALADLAEVTLIGACPEPVAGVRHVPVEHGPSPNRVSAWNEHHWWSVGILEALRLAFPDDGPDVVEFPDHEGSGAVTLQARLTCDPLLKDTAVCVRLRGTREMTDVLDGASPAGFDTQLTYDLERYCLRHADRLLHSGDGVMHAYRSFYDDEALASDAVGGMPQILLPAGDHAARAEDAPLRLLQLGPLSRRAGVPELVSAVLGLERDDWHLTLCGPDTPTAPLGRSMREVIELQAAGDARVSFRDHAEPQALPALIAEHDVIVTPTLFEADPSSTLAVLGANRPVLSCAAGVGGDLLDERSGWLCPARDERALRGALAELIAEPGRVRDLIASGGPHRRAEELGDPETALQAYSAIGRSTAPSARPRSPRLVSVVVPYHGLSRHVGETLDSVFSSTYEPIEVILVNDGSFAPEDEEALSLAQRPGLTIVHQPNAGPSAARNLGFALARGDYLLPVDADDLVEPELIERCVEVLDSQLDHAFVTSWARHIDTQGTLFDGGFLFLGNEPRCVLERNVAGTPSALLRRELVEAGNAYTPDLVTHEDWSVYRTMHQRGLYGHVIPEFLFRYRVRPGSMTESILHPNDERLRSEVRARGRQVAVSWSPAS